EVLLADSHVPPNLPYCLRDPLTPVADCLVLCGRAFPHAAFRLDDPVDFAFTRLLNDDPVGMVEPDGPAGLQVVNPELRARFALLGSAKRRKPQHITCLLVKERGETALEVVVGRNVVEDR